jgi:hypothetical protein
MILSLDGHLYDERGVCQHTQALLGGADESEDVGDFEASKLFSLSRSSRPAFFASRSMLSFFSDGNGNLRHSKIDIKRLRHNRKNIKVYANNNILKSPDYFFKDSVPILCQNITSKTT